MRVLVVDYDELFRLGLEVTLLGFEGIEAVTSVAEGEEPLDRLREQRFDVVVLDLGLPGLGGMETCRRISQELPQLPVLVVTSQEDPVWCQRMVRAGARGYVRKGVAAADLQLAIQSVLRSASWWDANATEALRELGAAGADELGTGQASAGQRSTREAASLALLTPRQREVLEGMGRGWSNQQIADALGISLGTVRVHGHSIIQKLEVSNRTQAVLKLRP
jgi:two-component system NarL family response regulator